MRKKASRFSAIVLLVIGSSLMVSFHAAAAEFFELRTYYYTKAEQEAGLDQYLQNALLPALHRQGIRKVGVFKPIANDTGDW